MKKGTVLFIFCLSMFVSCGVQPQDQNFVENEKQVWESQDHHICDKFFGFAWGQGSWPSQIFSTSDIFDWIAVSDWEGFITIRVGRSLPRSIAKKFSKLKAEFDFSTSRNVSTIKILNNYWVGTHCRPKKALEDELQIIYEKTGLKMAPIEHDSLR